VPLLPYFLLKSCFVLLQSYVNCDLSLSFTSGSVEASDAVTAEAVLSRSEAVAIQLETARLLTAAAEGTRRLGDCFSHAAQAWKRLAEPQAHSTVKMAIVGWGRDVNAGIGVIRPQGFKCAWTARAVEDTR
jgi:hypothetical protein